MNWDKELERPDRLINYSRGSYTQNPNGTWYTKIGIKCSMCPVISSWLRDSHSMREFEITGMCQKCQDEIFNENA